MARIKNLEQTMRLLQSQQAAASGPYTENQHNRHNHGRQKPIFGSSNYLRPSYNSMDEVIDFLCGRLNEH